MGIHHSTQGPLGPLALTDMHDHFGGQRMPVQHAQVDIKQRLLFRTQAFRGALGQVPHFLTHPHQRIIQAGDFRADILHLTIRHSRQIRRREQQNPETDGRTRAAR